ncbi:YcaO-related McrA-glycine thioamidation protein [Methanoplanus endosymbiosus]|uniref:YcaO-related McrA-glycine thioamidation protein n=1 Tax=Methanoplanus endosymbiosus TaxID=33865 RepID=A0A9E7PMA0_9EURY|nr:YcaO-related McrA-glycine thioamidation protein [Methanoplanus endosymbiosus]UUX91251.1 YcaO-related McrA-glycine thioamidation protein [Methanoplanus endosymbiosus]
MHRSEDTEKTLNLLKQILSDIGVTEVRDLTACDRVKIPVYSAITPDNRPGAPREHTGKGVTPADAETAAIMNAVESYCAEYRGERLITGSYENFGPARAVDPRELILPQEPENNQLLYWSPVWDILNEEEVLIPANAIYHPYDPPGMANQLFKSSTTGLAAGNNMEEAILHAMYQIIEKDAISIAESKRMLGRRLVIDTEGTAKDLLNKFKENGIEIHLWLLDGKTSVPVVAAAADDTETKDPAMLVTGTGAHLSPEIAVIRALTGIAKSRASLIADKNENAAKNLMIQKAGYERLKRINKMWFKENEDTIKISDIPDSSTDSIDGDIKRVTEEVERHADRICACDLTKTSIPVVKLVIPGFEVTHMDPTRIKK